VGRLLVVLLAAIVAVEAICVIGLAAALFWLGTSATIAVGAGMLTIATVAGLLALRAMRSQR
jgi:hypothetical protein